MAEKRMRVKNRKRFFGFIGILFSFCVECFMISFPIIVYAQYKEEAVPGKVYVIEDKDNYNLSSAVSVSSTGGNIDTYGKFSVSGDINTVTIENGIPVYSVGDGNLMLSYLYDDALMQAEKDEKHIIKDDSKAIDGIELNNKIRNGGFILQISRDGRIWHTIGKRTNLFEDVPSQEKPFYETTNLQLINGCYYRVLVAYKTAIRTGSSSGILGSRDEYSITKYAEEYVFKAFNEAAVNIDVPDNNNRYTLGSKIRTKKIKGYTGEEEITNSDPHIGWDIGQFFVSGFTDRESDKDNIVFLKDTGDKLALWFQLNQNIDACHNNKKISVVEDTTGYDIYFEVPGGVNETMNFGRGALIVRKINPDNTRGIPQIYTNYLEASASPDAITKVDLFEEGDYEVALDYKLQYDKTEVLGHSVLPEEACYKIYFKFSVRNANSMVFLFDNKTGSELSNGSITENGFRIDTANSQYLKVTVKREILKDGFDGLTEDTRHNSSATNGDVFTEEGVYTITASTEYAAEPTVKRVYVGNNNILKAYMVTGLTIAEINEKVAHGAVINDDGTIEEPLEEEVIVEETEEESLESASEMSETASVEEVESQFGGESEDESNLPQNEQPKAEPTSQMVFPIVAVVVVLAVFIVVRALGRKKK